MTNEEKLMVDLEGYLVIKDVLTPDEVAEMNEIANRVFPRKPGDPANMRTSRVSFWGEPFKRLIDHSKIVPYLIELIGPKFRLDHDYCIFMTEGAKGGSLHGGEDGGRPGGNEGDHWYKYRDSVMRNGLCVITYFLTDAAEGDTLDSLIRHAADLGCVGVRGRVQPELLDGLIARRCVLFHVSATMVHARNKDLLAEIRPSRSLLTGLAGEGWTRLIGGEFA
jgi:hypothetical protein